MVAKITGLNQFQARLRTQTKRMRDDAADIVDETAEYGAALMKEYIATRGTGWVGKGARATPEGRIDTGQMYDDVHAEDPRTRKSDIVAEFGWTEHVEGYYLTQETQMTPGGHPPMHALLDAQVKAREYLISRLKARFK